RGVLTVRELRYFLLDLPGAGLKEFIGRGTDRIDTVLRQQRVKSSLADGSRADLAIEDTFDQAAHSNVVEKDFPEIRPQSTAFDNLRRRDTHTLIIDVPRLRIETDDTRTSDICVVS